MVFRTAIRLMTSKKPKPKMKPIELKGQQPEQTQTITRAIFDILKEQGPLTIAQTWERLQCVNFGHVCRHLYTILPLSTISIHCRFLDICLRA
ncbi:uncharacterized protein [Spinacia oleracea]|uniref:Uncharacterized protein isoform X2 n=1 Tax=Spinacia oleracea TaxID=3562 RepID=A0ABM3R150_SPIOL|nr:uncharacterized protein LOC110794184 isoform X2 [Spinacia oleracea]